MKIFFEKYDPAIMTVEEAEDLRGCGIELELSLDHKAIYGVMDVNSGEA